MNALGKSSSDGAGARRSDAAHHAEAGSRGESRRGDGDCGSRQRGEEGAQWGGSRCRTAAREHWQIRGDGGREQWCVSEFAERRHEHSEVAQKRHQTFQVGSGKQPQQPFGSAAPQEQKNTGQLQAPTSRRRPRRAGRSAGPCAAGGQILPDAAALPLTAMQQDPAGKAVMLVPRIAG